MTVSPCYFVLCDRLERKKLKRKRKKYFLLNLVQNFLKNLISTESYVVYIYGAIDELITRQSDN